ncbi:MAG TPA: alpha/beta hydrolase-fold protein [Bryobacteraceae bacterium]|nr:alpha/beta hydrolase-fold protein [Bryobacteraceae bacterium]
MRKIIITAFLFAAFACAQSYVPGPQVLTFLSDIDDSDQPYALYLPKKLAPGKKYPLVISLHGAWSNHRLNLKRVFGKGNRPGENDAEASRYFPPFRDVDFIVASPYARGTMGYQGIPEQDVYDVLADVKRRFPVDEDRIYLTGLSMGGGGTLWLGLTRPDLWAAIAPVCAAAPAGADELAPNALNLPVHLFHGDQDPAVPVEASRTWHKRLLDLGTKAEYVEYPGVRHNSWDNAYANGAIFDWFGKFKRERFPDRVRFVTRAYQYPSAYWVRIDGLTPGELAAIDARFTAPNRIEVTSENVTGFTLLLQGHPKASGRAPVHVTINGTKVETQSGRTLSYTGMKPGKYTPPAGAKAPGAEGPVGAAVASRHIYVFGTQAGTKEQIAERREIAAKGAEWSTPQLRLLLSHRVAADRDIREADTKGANLVLFGNRETNSVLAGIAGKLPLELNAGAADYGLIFVAPVNGKYVVVNSGLPWWTGQENAQRPGLRFLRAPYAALLTLGDYILFKGSLANVVAEGRFDNTWKLSAADRAKIEATGAVVIR